jgi:hypothetical protein
MIYFKILLLMLITPLVGVIQAQEDQDKFDHLEEFCFKNVPSEEELTQQLSFLLIKGEHVLPSSTSHCLHILTTPERSGLFQQYIPRHFTLVKASASSAAITNHQCNIKVFKKKDSQEEKQDIQINPFKKNLHLEQQNKEQEAEGSMQVYVQSGQSAYLSVDHQQLKITCTKTHAGLFSLEISIKSTNDVSLATSIQVKADESFPLGSVLDQKEHKGQELSLGKGAQWQSSTSSQKNLWFLKVH